MEHKLSGEKTADAKGDESHQKPKNFIEYHQLL